MLEDSKSSFGSEVNRYQNDYQVIGNVYSTSQKHSVIPADMENYEDFVVERGSAVTGGGLPDFKSLVEGTFKGPYTSLTCRSLRIGSYKVMPKERVIFAPEGIKIKIPPISKENGKEMVTIDIPVRKIIKLLAHFGKSLPVFFVYVNPSMGCTIRNALKMTDQSGLYFDPCSLDESQKRIIILPDKLMEDGRSLFKQLFKSKLEPTAIGATSNMGLLNKIITCPSKESPSKSSPCILEELDQKGANEILIRSSPPEVQNIIKKNTICNLDDVKILFIYPPAPQKGGITISSDDYACLEEQEFLNDVIIDFYLKWLLHDKLPEIQRKQTHVFSTFFYKRLTSKPKTNNRPHAIEDDPRLTAAEKRHARVKSWTKKIDIFSKDYIIVPINEHSHWFLAIICYPGLDGPVCMSTNTPVSSESLIEKERTLSTHANNRMEIPIINDDEYSDLDEAEGDFKELEDNADKEVSQPPVKKLKTECNPGPPLISDIDKARITKETGSGDMEKENCKMAIKQPCILIFDSLSGGNRSRIVATLRDYLAVEHATRKEVEKSFTKDSMKGACPKVPQQMNYSDCGIFTLQFAESFFEHPLKDYTFPIHGLAEWFPQELVQGKRESIAKLIKSLMEQYNSNHNHIELPDISFAPQKNDDALKVSGFIETNGNSISKVNIAKMLTTMLESEKSANVKKSNEKEENR